MVLLCGKPNGNGDDVSKGSLIQASIAWHSVVVFKRHINVMALFPLVAIAIWWWSFSVRLCLLSCLFKPQPLPPLVAMPQHCRTEQGGNPLPP